MKKTIFIMFCIFSISKIGAQSKLDQAIESIQNKFSQEKTYLLFDKQKYVAGDIMRFKAYVFNGYTPTDISSTLFVELYDRDKKLIDKKMLPIEQGQTDGSFTIKDDIKEVVYFVRAYTTWMENFSQKFEIVETIPIFNPKSEQKLAITDNPKWSILARPEGGNLVNNIPTKVAVRYITEAVPPKSWTGYLITSDKPNEKILSFNNLDQNVALFTFTPKINENYQVVVEDKKGNKQITQLPIVADSGLGFQVVEDQKGIKYKLNAANLPNGFKDYKIVGTINNMLAYKANIKTIDKVVTSTIPIKSSDEVNGVLQLSVFDANDNLVAQRLSFIHPKKLYIDQPELANRKFDIKPRAYSSFDIIPNDNYSHYSVVVKDSQPKKDEDVNHKNLLSALWLTGDFSNPIFSPAQYFKPESNTEALDALLMSEKWQRFDWNSIFSGQLPSTKYKPIKFLSYKARLAVNSRALANTPVSLIFKAENEDSKLTSFVTDDNGYINLNNILIEGPVTVHYYLNAKKENESVPDNLTLTFQNLVEPTVFKGDLPETKYYLQENKSTSTLYSSVSKAINNRKNEIMIKDEETQIEEVKILVKKQDLKKKLNDELTTGMFNSQNATIIDLVNENQDAVSGNILEWLQGRAAGITFQRDNYGNLIPIIRNSPAGLYLNEMKTDPSAINSISITDIAMVKIFRGAGLIGDAVAIYTRKGNMPKSSEKEPSKNNKVIFTTYDKSSPFELPDFSKNIYKTIASDSREVLYWNPNLSEPDNVPPRAKFFNNDDAKNFDITIIGIGKNDSILFYNETTK